MIIAVDFDGFLFEDGFPDVGSPILPNIKFVLELQELGAELILWTCRGGQPLVNAVNACRAYGIDFVAINDDAPSTKLSWRGDFSRKVYADYYLDDRIILNKEEFLIRMREALNTNKEI